VPIALYVDVNFLCNLLGVPRHMRFHNLASMLTRVLPDLAYKALSLHCNKSLMLNDHMREILQSRAKLVMVCHSVLVAANPCNMIE